LNGKDEKSGSEDEVIRAQWKDSPEIADKIIANNRKINKTESEIEVIRFELFEENLETFRFFFDYCGGKSAFNYGAMGGLIGFDWVQVHKLAEIVDFIFKKEQLNQFQIIENTILSEFNKKK